MTVCMKVWSLVSQARAPHRLLHGVRASLGSGVRHGVKQGLHHAARHKAGVMIASVVCAASPAALWSMYAHQPVPPPPAISHAAWSGPQALLAETPLPEAPLLGAPLLGAPLAPELALDGIGQRVAASGWVSGGPSGGGSASGPAGESLPAPSVLGAATVPPTSIASAATTPVLMVQNQDTPHTAQQQRQVQVPEPTVMALLVPGCVALMAVRFVRRRSKIVGMQDDRFSANDT